MHIMWSDGVRERGRRTVLVVVALMVASCSADTADGPPATAAPVPSSTEAAPISVVGPIDLTEISGRIAFSYDDGVWVSDATGANRVQLTSDGGFDPTWSPDATKIVYRTLTEADDGELWIMQSDGSNPHDLVNDPDYSDWGPAWSPDGTTIAFNSNRVVGHAIWLMNADGSDQRPVTRLHGEYPSWSPDSTAIAYSGGSYYDIRRVNRDGSDDGVVIADPAYEMGPAWSPDGEWIAYHTQADATSVGEQGMGPEMEIHLVHPDGSGDHRITTDNVEDSFPAWSPDGRFLMWSRHGQLVLARPDGSGMVEIGAGNFPAWVA